MKIAIMGFGTVGRGAYETCKSVPGIEVKRILVRRDKPQYDDVRTLLTTSIDDIISDPDIELVVESIGGIEPAKTYELACLNAGKHVVTPNKSLVSECYGEMTAAAEANNVEYRYTPSVGGGIPWLFNLRRCTRSDKLKEISGIVNGTCNFILDSMHTDGSDFDEILRKAQELGYAEADPSADIEGTDTLRKTVISVNNAWGTVINEADVPCYGIDTISAGDIAYFNEHGYTCKLMMRASLNGDKLSAYVEPTLVSADSLEANVRKNFNLVSFISERIGKQSFYGQGAGSEPTGQSVIQDVIDIRDGINPGATAAIGYGEDGVAIDNSSAIHRYYIRHNRMCEHISPIIESYEEKDGIFYCISKPLSVEEMHAMGRHRKEKGKPMFFAAISE